jgi:DnaJ domain
VDLVRACAVLGVTPSATAREAKRAYKKLVRRWHPDRFANDPQGEREATARLQQITEAYQAIVQALGPGGASVPAGGRAYEPGVPLSREEIERLVETMRVEGPLEAFFNQPMWWWPLPLGLFFLATSRGSSWHLLGGAALVAAAPVLWWLERRQARGPR